MFKQYGYPQTTPLLVLMEKFEPAVALLDYHFTPGLQPMFLLFRSLLLPSQTISLTWFDAWFAAYALAVRLLHYRLLAWLAIYAVAGRGVPAVF